jgi:hypothetical protein
MSDKLVVVNPSFVIHGSFDMPASKGYELAYVSSDVEFENDFVSEISAGESRTSWSISSFKEAMSSFILPARAPTAISSSYNIIGGLIALTQAIYTSVTLYHTSGDQIDQYGYAAFALTVAPFVLMSIINLIGNIFSPTYNAIYMIETSVMTEARRHGCHFDGVVGKLKERRGASLISAKEEINWVNSAVFEGIGENDKLTVDIFPASVDDLESSSSQKSAGVAPGEKEHIQLRSTGKGAKASKRIEQENSGKFTVANNTLDEDLHYVIGIPSCPLTGNAASRRPDVYILNTDLITLETHINPSEDNYKSTARMVDFWGKVVIWGMLLALAPVTIVGGLSHFHSRNSTVAQRAWTMAWLTSDIIAGLVLGGVLMPSDKEKFHEHYAQKVMVAYFFIFGAPALGGLVVVGQMVREYGSCITLP